MNTVLVVGIIALVLVTLVMIAAIVSTVVDSTSRRRAHELYWELVDVQNGEGAAEADLGSDPEAELGLNPDPDWSASVQALLVRYDWQRSPRGPRPSQ